MTEDDLAFVDPWTQRRVTFRLDPEVERNQIYFINPATTQLPHQDWYYAQPGDFIEYRGSEPPISLTQTAQEGTIGNLDRATYSWWRRGIDLTPPEPVDWQKLFNDLKKELAAEDEARRQRKFIEQALRVPEGL